MKEFNVKILYKLIYLIKIYKDTINKIGKIKGCFIIKYCRIQSSLIN